MKINIILPSIGNSGGIDVIYKYVNLLSKKGNDIIVYKEIKSFNMHRYNNRLKNNIHQIYCSLKAINASFAPKQNDKFVWKITDKTVRNADVIIATSWPTAYTVKKLSKEKGDKYYFIQDFEIWDNRKLGLESYILPLKKIVISTWINQQLKASLGIGPFPVVVNGIDTNKYHSKNYNCEQNNRPVQFLMLNHTLEKKGVSFGIKAYERIHLLFPNTKLKMFGRCSNTNIPEYIEYEQNPDQDLLIQLYCESDIFIFPSLEEGWGLTPLEAMACGCVVVGTRTGFVLDLGENRENMMISEPGDINGMVENIKEILNNKALLRKIRKNGMISAHQLDWDSSANKLLDIIGRKKFYNS